MNQEFEIAGLIELAHDFRLGRSVSACLSLSEKLAVLIPIVSKISAKNTALFEEIIGNILDCQMRRDWLGLADYLEYEIPELLISE